MKREDFLDNNSIMFLDRVLRQGTAVLFTGAGFSSGAISLAGSPLPLGWELKAELWKIAFPGESVDAGSSLGEVYEIAVGTHRRETQALLTQLLTADSSSIPKYYETVFRVPWFRVYTLNVDTLIPAIQGKFNLPNDIHSISAIRDQIPIPETLSAVHLNGKLTDFPDMTFSPPQYGQRAAHPDFAYGALVRDLIAHCVVFIGTQLDEAPLWQHVAMRGDKPGYEVRPKSFLVSPSLPRARAALLQRYNVRHIPMGTEEFADLFLKPVADEGGKRPYAVVHSSPAFQRVDTALAEPAQELPDFLLGREPTWADIREGFAIARAFEGPLLQAAINPSLRVLSLVGTAGSGKSTTARRLALALQAEGRDVYWLRLDAPQAVAQLRSAGLNSGGDVLVIDRAERFGDRGVELIRALAEQPNKPQIVATYASTAFDELKVEEGLTGVKFESFVVPLLKDEDIHGLLSALRAANRLGRLSGLTPDRQFAAFKERSGRQLLVAMFEATSGQRFEEKIFGECDGLSPDLHLAYAVAALATVHRYRLRTEDILSALSDVTAGGLEVIDRLARQHLLLRSQDGSWTARHPVIAREALTYYRQSGNHSACVVDCHAR
jgi:hypothetical protein